MKNGPQVDSDLCTGCGACINVCCKNVYEMMDGKAVAARPEDCCGTGEKCLPACPTGAITFPAGRKRSCSCNCGCSGSSCC